MARYSCVFVRYRLSLIPGKNSHLTGTTALNNGFGEHILTIGYDNIVAFQKASICFPNHITPLIHHLKYVRTNTPSPEILRLPSNLHHLNHPSKALSPIAVPPDLRSRVPRANRLLDRTRHRRDLGRRLLLLRPISLLPGLRVLGLELARPLLRLRLQGARGNSRDFCRTYGVECGFGCLGACYSRPAVL